MTAEAWATIAAFTAAGLSFINVLVGATFTRRVGTTQWRRTAELEFIAGFIKNLDEYLKHLLDVAKEMDDYVEKRSRDTLETGEDHGGNWSRIGDKYVQINRIHDLMRGQLAEAYLIAGATVVTRIERVMETLEIVQHGLRPGGPEGKVGTFWSRSEDTQEARKRLIDAVRIEIGVDNRTSMWRRRATRPIVELVVSRGRRIQSWREYRKYQKSHRE